MPYSLYKNGSKVCVKNSETGESKGCSDSRAKAVAHMRALYAAEGGAKMGKKETAALDDLIAKEIGNFNAQYPPNEDELKELDDLAAKHYADSMSPVEYIPWGIVSFSDLDAYRAAEHSANMVRQDTQDFMSMMSNIIANPDIENKSKAMQALIFELEKRTGEDMSGEVMSGEHKEKETQEQTAPPAADAPQKNKIKAVIADISEKIKEVFGEEDDDLSKIDNPDGAGEEDSMTWYDKETGTWRWLARYSNKFRDRDNPPEIISSDSHRRFVERVEKGLAPLPELWLWHIKDWKLGQGEWVAYDDSGFALAAGTYSPGCEQVAEWLSHQKGWGVSHGMPPYTIKRNETDPTIIEEHETREISFLPRDAAANLLTDFISLKKEEEMAIPNDKKKTLIESWGMSPDLLAKLEQLNADTAEKATSAGMESKETSTDSTVEETPAPADSTVTQETPEAETPALDMDAPASRKETVEAFAAIVTPFVEEQHILKESVATLTEAIKELAAQMTELKASQSKEQKSEEERVKETIKGTPMASLAALLMPSAIGAHEAEVDGRTALAKSKPKETSVDNIQGATPIPFINKFLAATPREQEQ